MNQHYFDVPFGFAGDVTSIPDPLQVGGTISMTEGWNFNYQRDLATDPAALPIDRSTMNWLLLQITTALQALQTETVPEFILASQNGGVAISYGLGAEVLWSASGNAPFQKFVSIIAANANTPSASDVLGTTTGWQVVCDPIATSAQASAGTNNASIMTPLLVAQQTALRALLAGSSTQVFNVGLATSATHAVEFGQLTGVIGSTRNLVCTNLSGAAGTSLVYTADALIVGSALGGLQYALASFNQTMNGATTGIGGLDTGALAASSYYAIYAAWNPTTQAAGIFAQLETGTPTTVYSGSHLPAGYTATALIGEWITNPSAQFVQAFQHDRHVTTTSLASNTFTAALTNASITLNVPYGAKKAQIGSTQTTTSGATSYEAVLASSSPVVGGTATLNASISTAAASLELYAVPGYVDILTPRTCFGTWIVVGGASPQLVLAIAGYDI